jgi:hypothetical protein
MNYAINTPVSIKQQLNNGMLTAVNAMPQKDSTSDGQNSFSMGRMIYNKANFINGPQYVSGINTGRTSSNTILNAQNTVVQPINKKWLGNRDASQITNNRRNVAMGTSINTRITPLSFETHSDINTTNDALRRVRGGGAVAPPKKNANRNNKPTPGYPPSQTQYHLSGTKPPYLYH